MDQEPCYLVIPAAGLGTRMRAVNLGTSRFRPDVPKEMLPVGNKPAIQYAVEEGLSAGIRNIVVIISRQKEMIRRYFEDRRFRQQTFPLATAEMDKVNRLCSLTFLYQKEPLGESDAISLASGITGSNSLAIVYPDNIYFPVQSESPAPGALQTLKSAFRKYRTDVIGMMEVTDKNSQGISNSGKVDIKPVTGGIFRIEKFHSKRDGFFVPRFRGELRTCGFMISGPHLFEYINKARKTVRKGEFTDMPVRNLIRQEKGIFGCLLPGTVFDIGNPAGYKALSLRVKPLNFN